MFITTQSTEQLAAIYKSYSMSSRVIFLCYPGFITDELISYFKNNFQAITKAKYREESDILTLQPSDFSELYIKDDEDNEYIIKDYFNTYARAIEMTLLTSNSKINIVEWVPGLHTRLYKDSYKDNKIIHVVPAPKQKAWYMKYLLENEDYKTLNMISGTYDEWLKMMKTEADERLHQYQEVYETLTITVGINNENKNKVSSPI